MTVHKHDTFLHSELKQADKEEQSKSKRSMLPTGYVAVVGVAVINANNGIVKCHTAINLHVELAIHNASMDVETFTF